MQGHTLTTKTPAETYSLRHSKEVFQEGTNPSKILNIVFSKSH